MDHWLRAILFTTTIAAYAGFMWIGFAFVVHAHRRIVIMLDTGYYWKDAGAILRREKRAQYGPKPGAHRPRPRAQAQVLAIKNSPPWPDPEPPDIIDALRMVPETDLLVPDGWIPATSRDQTVPIGMGVSDLPATRTIELGGRGDG